MVFRDTVYNWKIAKFGPDEGAVFCPDIWPCDSVRHFESNEKSREPTENIFSCFWKEGEGDSEYKHISELDEDDFLNVQELDHDYFYVEEVPEYSSDYRTVDLIMINK